MVGILTEDNIGNLSNALTLLLISNGPLFPTIYMHKLLQEGMYLAFF